jgi:hypothetical protein
LFERFRAEAPKGYFMAVKDHGTNTFIQNAAKFAQRQLEKKERRKRAGADRANVSIKKLSAQLASTSLSKAHQRAAATASQHSESHQSSNPTFSNSISGIPTFYIYDHSNVLCSAICWIFNPARCLLSRGTRAAPHSGLAA